LRWEGPRSFVIFWRGRSPSWNGATSLTWPKPYQTPKTMGSITPISWGISQT